MKKTIRINIGGAVFYIDEDAYLKLSNYLNAIKRNFATSEEQKEIIGDIELRVAELFAAQITPSKQSIELSDVDNLVRILGRPEDFSDQDTSYNASSQKTYNYSDVGNRRMYRDADQRVLGGVCGGIGNFFSIDPLVIRLIFVFSVLLYGTGGFIYIILWILIPVAATRSQKMEMKGEPITIQNIENSVKEEFEHVKNTVQSSPLFTKKKKK